MPAQPVPVLLVPVILVIMAMVMTVMVVVPVVVAMVVAVMVIVIVPEWLLYTGPIANWLPPSGVAVPPSEPADQVTFWTVAPLGSEAVTLTVSVCR